MFEDEVVAKLIVDAVKRGLIPRILYKYRPFNSYSESLFCDAKLWFSPPHEFNDPFDCRIRGKENYTRSEVREYFISIGIHSSDAEVCTAKVFHDAERGKNFFEMVIENALKGIGICCFSKTFKNHLMWSHYSDCHRGFVIGFDVLKDPGFFSSPLVVNYQEDYPIISYWGDKKMVSHCIGAKAKIWAYEEEARVIKDKPGLHSFKRRALKEVYFGCKMPLKSRQQILSWLKKYSFHPEKIQIASPSKTKYELDFQNVE